MDERVFSRPTGVRLAASAIATALLALAPPLGSAMAENEVGEAAVAAPQDLLSETAEAEMSVAEAFAPLPDPALQDEAPDGAVDITAFDPPIEVEEEPETSVVRSLGTGHASYYGKRFHGRRTANGERFDMNAMTAAHKTLPFGTMVAVTNPRNGKSVTVRINDRGPFIRGRTIDLSRAAAQRIGLVARGHGPVQLAVVR